MSPPPDHPPVRRVVLPSGRTIEVLLFDRPEPAPEAAPAELDLHLCPGCGSDFVHPVHWEESGTEQWEVRLRCPECEEQTTGFFAHEAIARLDEELDRGTALLVETLRRISRANFEDGIDRFVAALERDLVLPEDF